MQAVFLTRAEHKGFYEDFSNGAIWPVFHDLIDQLPLLLEGWSTYQDVNEKFAARRRRRLSARRHDLGARLPPHAGAGDGQGAGAQGAHRLLPAHPIPGARRCSASCRERRELWKACSAPT